ncbi:S-layer family protein [Arthrobacter sp. ZGTC131]|uniref:beta strand repeat-containing protein n=1 Tax=Arthrobacter sp. ZGTC131 TaxID=2058898 RepID=UPI0015E39E35|nr:carboxypeptidase regulatory-like domain-containing protein [Arthrobacter sp. ZGTC131]
MSRRFRFRLAVLLSVLSALVLFGLAPANAADLSDASISGKVTAPAGVNLTATNVYAYTADGYSGAGHGQLNDDGSYTVTGLPAGSYKVQFTGNNSGGVDQWYAGATSFDAATPVTLTSGQGLTGIDVVLVKGASISGKVTVPAGADVTGVGVMALATESPWQNGYGRVNADGTYTLRGLAAGPYKVQFTGNNSGAASQWYGGGATSSAATPVVLGAGQDLTGISPTLAMGASISGTVTAPAGLDPNAGQVNFVLPDGNWENSVQIGADGAYKVTGLPAGTYKVQFSGNSGGSLDQWYAGASSEATATPVTLAAGEDRTGIDAILVKGASISGKVTAPAGVNPASIQATVYQAGGTNPNYVASSSVNDDGTYKVAGLPSGSYKVQFAGYNTGALVQWYAGAASFEAATPVTLTAGQDHVDINATLVKGASISGKVTAPAGINLSGVQAYLYTSDSYYSFAASVDVAADGSYNFAGLAAGSYKVQFAAGTSGALDQWYGGLSHSAATTVPVSDSQDLALSDTPLVKGATISGNVTAPAGVNLSAVTARVYNADNFRASAVTAQVRADGTYRVTGLRAGNYKVQFSGYDTGALTQWYASGTTMETATLLPLTAGQDLTGIDATLTKGASITGKITVPAGVDLTMVNVSATAEGSANGTYGQVNADGTYAIKGLVAGTYKVKFSSYNSGALDEWYNNVQTAAEATPITLTLGEDRTAVDATLAKGAAISGKVTLPAAGYSSEAYITAYKASDNSMAGSTWANADGTYSLRGLLPGNYKISFSAFGTGALPQWYKNASSIDTATTVPVTEGQDVTAIDATLIKGGTISGKITAPAGTNLNASQIIATKNGASNAAPAYGYVNPDGTYSVIGLEAGTYTVRFSGGQSGAADAWHGGATAASATPVTVTVSQTVTGVDMTAVTGASIQGKVTGASTATGYLVSVLDNSGKTVKNGVSDPSGNYSVVGLAEGSYKVAFNRSSGYSLEEAQFFQNKPESAGVGQAQSIPVTPGQPVQNIDATLTSGGSVTGTLLNKEGKPFSAFVQAYTIDGSLVTRAGLSDADGKYTIKGLTSGNYILRVSGGPVTGDLYSGNAATEATATPVTVTSGNATTHDLSYASGSLTAPVPTITGTAKEGSTLTAVPGTWAPEGVALTYQWKSNGTAVGLAIAGATASTYKLTAADVGKTITVTVTGTKGGYTTAAQTSARTATVMALNPVLTAPVPAITGTAKVGSTLTAAPGTWGPVSVALGYQWKANGIAIAGATASTYKPAAADVAKTLTVTVTGTRAGYTTAAKTSAATAKVAVGTLSVPVPAITGAAKVGSTLTAAGTWGPAPVTLKYQWKANGIAITGATASTYKPAATLLGKALTVTVTGSKAGYTAVTKTSAATAKIAAGTLTAPVPVITGTAKVGYALTATGTWGPAPVTLKYQWKANGIAITGATASTYRPVSAVVGKTLTVTVTGAKTAYTTVAKTSAATVKVAAGTLTAPVPAITGTAKVGSLLTAAPGVWGPAPVTLTYQWKANGIAITGAAASTYRPAAAVLGKTITVTVTGSKAGYTAAAKTSAATATVAVGTLTAPTPTITGAVKVGSTLTAGGLWGPAPVTLTYQWKANGIAITGATASTYKPAAAVRGKILTVTVTGRKAAYTAVAKTSAGTVKVV